MSKLRFLEKDLFTATHMPEWIKVVVCELQLLKGDQLSHPVSSGCRRVWVNVESSRHGRLCFACNHPMKKKKLRIVYFSDNTKAH